MVDQPKAIKKPESAETPTGPMPSSKQTPSSDELTSPEKTGEGETDTKDDLTLPESVKERTAEQFEKLKNELREEKERRLRSERVFQQMNQTQTQSAPSEVDYFDPETGEVDVNKLKADISQTKLEAKQAMNAAQRIISENDRKQESVAYKSHPELDPGDKSFNEDFQKAVIGYLANVYAEGKNITLKQAADKVKSFNKVDIKKAQETGAAEALESLSPKEQASLEATGRSDRRQQVTNLSDLQERTRKGDKQAILERLKSVPIIGR